jgi:hypothetical protein
MDIRGSNSGTAPFPKTVLWKSEFGQYFAQHPSQVVAYFDASKKLW